MLADEELELIPEEDFKAVWQAQHSAPAVEDAHLRMLNRLSHELASRCAAADRLLRVELWKADGAEWKCGAAPVLRGCHALLYLHYPNPTCHREHRVVPERLTQTNSWHACDTGRRL